MLNPGELAILLVEDNPVDVTLLRRGFRDPGITHRLLAVSDGAQAIQHLDGQGSYSNRTEFPLPKRILLDSGLPNADGFEVLRWLCNHHTLRHLPVIVLSGSAFSPDAKRAYATGANSC